MFQRILILPILAISSAASAQDAIQTTPQLPTLKAGTDVTLRLMAQYSPKHAKLGDRVAFTTVWRLDVEGTHVWPSGHPVNGRVTSLKPIVEVTLDPQTLPVGQVKFAGHPFEVLGYGKDRPPPSAMKATAAPSTTADKVGGAVGGTVLLGAFAVGETGRFIRHPFGGSSLDRGVGTVTVVKVAEDVPIAQTQVNR